MSYSSVYPKIMPKAVLISRIAAPNIWKGPKRDRVLFARLWLADMARLYHIECPRFRFVDDTDGYDACGGGSFSPSTWTVTLFAWSFVTLAHEFRHAVQAADRLTAFYLEDPEEDARAWSISLFRRACPLSYARAAAAGRIYNEPAPGAGFLRAISPALDVLQERHGSQC